MAIVELDPEEAPAAFARPGRATVAVDPGPRDWQPIVERAAKKYNIDPLLIRAIIMRESGGNPSAEGPDTAAQPGKKAQGLMQLMPGTAKDMGVTDPFDMEQNIEGGTKYFRQLLDHSSAKGDIPTALLHYVGGRDPKNWGAQSFAYPHLVLDQYRKLGGRLMDPALPQASFSDRLANAMLPFDGMARAKFGRGPDLSQGPSGPEGNLPVGAKLKAWWNGTSPDLAAWRKVMQNYQDNNPLLSIGADVAGGLPSGVAMGGILGKGLGVAAENVPAVLKPMMQFLAGQSGRGLPITGEGANLGVRALSGGAAGALQGAAAGAANSFLNPEQTTGKGAALGGLVGGALGTALPLGGAAIARGLFGKRLDPAVAQLGQEAIAGGGKARPAVPLTADLDQVNQLALDPKQFSRAIGEMVGEPTPFQVSKGQLPRARAAIGKEFEDNLPQLHVAVDRDLLSGVRGLLNDAQNDPNTLAELRKIPAVKKIMQELSHAANMTDGMMAGKDYAELVRQGSKPGLVSVLGNNKNPAIAEFGRKLRGLLDEALDRGTQEKIQMALAQGDADGAGKLLAAHTGLLAARQKWKMLKPIEAALDPVTQSVVPGRLYSGAEKVGGDLEQLGRIGMAFDPANKAPHVPMSVPYSAVAAGAGLAAQDPVSTGKAALALGVLNRIGRVGQQAVRHMPGYENALLRRSRTFGPGPMESALRTLGLPGAVRGAMSGNPLVTPANQEQWPE